VIVAADSSTLIILAKLAQFDLLRLLFSHVYISAEVRNEVVMRGEGRPGSLEIARSNWIEAKELQNSAELLVLQERHGLGVGELSTILLAEEIGASLILLDDHEARKLAQERALRVKGTLGLLEIGHKRGHLDDLRGAFAQLLKHSRIDKSLLDLRLQALGLPSL
jgi:uncharacterized protein